MIKLSERIGYLEELSRLQRESITVSHNEHPSSNKEESDELQATVSEELEVLETANSAQEVKENEGAIAIVSSTSDDPERQKKIIFFEDSVGRKFTFPFHIAAKWAVRLHNPPPPHVQWANYKAREWRSLFDKLFSMLK
jgi:hypothetical protein